jgi:hypothetical protein
MGGLKGGKLLTDGLSTEPPAPPFARRTRDRLRRPQR